MRIHVTEKVRHCSGCDERADKTFINYYDHQHLI